jgi:hypothetical protein
MALRALQTDSKASEHDKVKALDQAYEQAMKRIAAQVADSYMLAKQVLSWITCSETANYIGASTRPRCGDERIRA